MSTSPERTRIFSHFTKSRFLHIEDSLERGKLRFFIGQYQKGQGAGMTAFAFMDVEDARVIMSDLAWGKAVEFVDFKGGRHEEGGITSRVLKIQSKPSMGSGQQSAVSHQRVWIQVANGPGESLVGGAVKPRGQPTAEISIALSVYEARKMGFAVLAYLQAWEIKTFHHEGHEEHKGN